MAPKERKDDALHTASANTKTGPSERTRRGCKAQPMLFRRRVGYELGGVSLGLCGPATKTRGCESAKESVILGFGLWLVLQDGNGYPKPEYPTGFTR